MALWSRYADAAGIELASSWRRPSRSRRHWPRGRRLDDARRQTALEHVEQGDRAQERWIWLPSSSHRSWVRHLLRSARQPVGAHLGAARRLDRLVDRQDDFRDPRLGRAARQPIAAARTAHALHQAGAPQPGKKLLQIGQRDFLPGRDIGQRHRLGLRMTRQIDHRHDGVTAFGAELHSILLMPALGRPSDRTPKGLENQGVTTIFQSPRQGSGEKPTKSARV